MLNGRFFSGLTIFLPTDGLASFGDIVSVVYNAVDVFGTDGSFDTKVSVFCGSCVDGLTCINGNEAP